MAFLCINTAFTAKYISGISNRIANVSDDDDNNDGDCYDANDDVDNENGTVFIEIVDKELLGLAFSWKQSSSVVTETKDHTCWR